MKKLGQIFLIVNLLILDAVGLYWFVQRGNIKSLQVVNQGQNSTSNLEEKLATDTCGEECKAYINEKISSVLSGVTPTVTPKEEKKTQTPVPTRTKVKNVSYVPIPGSGNTLNTSWTTIAGTDFYLSKGDYPGLTGIYFEANMKLVNGNGIAYLRVYDMTHSIAVNGSEIQSSSQTSTFVTSGAISLWDGYNHYVIQARSLTADTTVFESGRLKFITEN